MQLLGAPLNPADISWIERTAQEGYSRTDLARRLCDRLGLRNARGVPREVSVRIELSRLAKRGLLSLPAVADPFLGIRGARPIRPRAVVAQASLPKRSLKELGPLVVHLVEGRSDPRHAGWKACLEDYHYLGAGPLCGAQLRYVVVADEKIVGAISFSAAARHLVSRDVFIGWSQHARRLNRELVVQQSRFCLSVQTKNLASRVQSMVLGRLATDWEKAYGYRPLLVETYVERERFDGSSYRASNWEEIGTTAGRGRQDGKHLLEKSVKQVFVYPLDPHFRERLCLEPIREIDPEADWAETEWGGVDLGDRRLTRRLVNYGRACGQRPTASLPQVCGSRAATKAAYRLLNHPEACMDTLLSSHLEATLARAAGQSVVLSLSDTSTLNYSTHPETEGLGPIGSNGPEGTLGLLVHNTLLSNTAGTPLGLLDIHAWVRNPEAYGQSDQRHELPLEEKESRKWMISYEAADRAAKRLKKTQVVMVADREADIFELLVKASQGSAKLLVRAKPTRRIRSADDEIEGPLWECLRAEPASGGMEVEIPRSGSRARRTSELDLRYREVRLARPARADGPKSLTVWAVLATEKAAPDAQDPIEWLLLTTIPVERPEQAIEKVQWYMQRWLIEVFHRTLKSGCKIEHRHSTYADTIKAALAIDSVVAWRVMLLVKLGRELPDAPCTIFFEDLEWKALHCFIHKTPIPPKEAPSLKVAMGQVGSLGGHLGRKGDGPPGPKAIWKGLERLSDISATARVFLEPG